MKQLFIVMGEEKTEGYSWRDADQFVDTTPFLYQVWAEDEAEVRHIIDERHQQYSSHQYRKTVRYQVGETIGTPH